MSGAPILQALRAEAAALFPEDLPRRCALRRALTDDALLAADLPLFAPERTEDCIRRFTERGWRCRRDEKGWLLLDHDLPCLPMPEQMTALPGEAGCCLSILERHPGGGADLLWLRRLAKVSEESPQRFELLMQELHRALALMLRRHEVIPDLSGSLYAACHCVYRKTEEETK